MFACMFLPELNVITSSYLLSLTNGTVGNVLQFAKEVNTSLNRNNIMNTRGGTE